MREIKFRGINHETGEFVYGYYTKFVEGIRRVDVIISDIDGELTVFYIHDRETIGQYIGVKDASGAEIFDGDKLKAINEDNIGDNDCWYDTTVRCKRGVFIMDVPDCEYDVTAVAWVDQHVFKVNGNIHQYSHSLEDAKDD